MVKDRLRDFQQAREEEHTTEQFAISHNNEILDQSSIQITESEPKSFMADFFEDVDAIRQMIGSMRDCVGQLKLQQSSVMASPNRDEVAKEQLEELMAEITAKASKIRAKLKAMQETIGKEDSSDGTDASSRIRRTQHSTISREFVEVMAEYNKAQVDHRDACKARIKRQMEIAGRETSSEELDEMIESGNSAIFSQGVMTDTQQARQQLADIEARHDDIMKLEKSIRDLHDMFLDLAMMVESQGEVVDRIEYNVEQAGIYVDKGRKDLESAVKSQRKTRKKIIILVICVLILLAIIGAIIGATVR